MVVLVGLSLLLAFESFDAPLNVARWYAGLSAKPSSTRQKASQEGRLLLPKGGFIATKVLPSKGVLRLEIRFRHRGGDLVLTVHDSREPLSSPRGKPLRIKMPTQSKSADRVLVVSPTGARVDGEPLKWAQPIIGSFMLRAVGGDVELDEVRMTPKQPETVAPSRLENETLFYLQTPERYVRDGVEYRRVTVTLWDVPVALLLARGKTSRNDSLAEMCRIVQITDGVATARVAAGSELAMQDWRDEKRNLKDAAYQAYLAREYALLELLQQAQRAMNAALPRRKDLEPLVTLAAIRHANTARAALALAESQGAAHALKLIRAELPSDAGGRITSDQIRGAAARAARKLLGAAPAEWKGFQFDPSGRFAALEEARGHLR